MAQAGNTAHTDGLGWGTGLSTTSGVGKTFSPAKSLPKMSVTTRTSKQRYWFSQVRRWWRSEGKQCALMSTPKTRTMKRPLWKRQNTLEHEPLSSSGVTQDYTWSLSLSHRGEGCPVLGFFVLWISCFIFKSNSPFISGHLPFLLCHRSGVFPDPWLFPPVLPPLMCI